MINRIASAALVASLAIHPATAADKTSVGGDCCADLEERMNGTPDRGKLIRPAPDQSMCGGYPTGKGE